jgi:hypothetical protein
MCRMCLLGQKNYYAVSDAVNQVLQVAGMLMFYMYSRRVRGA